MGRAILVDYHQRNIMIDLPHGRGAIHEGTAEGVERILLKLNHNGHDPIRFFIHGHDGGDFYACLKIAHAIAHSASPVIMVPFERVRSGAFWLTQAAELALQPPITHSPKGVMRIAP